MGRYFGRRPKSIPNPRAPVVPAINCMIMFQVPILFSFTVRQAVQISHIGIIKPQASAPAQTIVSPAAACR